MDRYLERHKLLKLIKKEIENPNQFITSKEIELVIFRLPIRESLGFSGFTGESSQTLSNN